MRLRIGNHRLGLHALSTLSMHLVELCLERAHRRLEGALLFRRPSLQLRQACRRRVGRLLRRLLLCPHRLLRRGLHRHLLRHLLRRLLRRLRGRCEGGDTSSLRFQCGGSSKCLLLGVLPLLRQLLAQPGSPLGLYQPLGLGSGGSALHQSRGPRSAWTLRRLLRRAAGARPERRGGLVQRQQLLCLAPVEITQLGGLGLMLQLLRAQLLLNGGDGGGEHCSYHGRLAHRRLRRLLYASGDGGSDVARAPRPSPRAERPGRLVHGQQLALEQVATGAQVARLASMRRSACLGCILQLRDQHSARWS